MPTVLREDGIRLFFFSNERNEPPHIHIESAEKYAKFWLDPVSLAGSNNFSGPELTRLSELVRERSMLLKEKWDEFFSR